MSADFTDGFVIDAERDLYDHTELYREAIQWWNATCSRAVYRKGVAEDIRKMRRLGRRPERGGGWVYADKSLNHLPPEKIPEGAATEWEHQKRKSQNRNRWFYLRRVGAAMDHFPRQKDRWRHLGIRDAARIVLTTVIITRPDFDAARVGLDERTKWGNGRLTDDDEGFGREWGDGSFTDWDDGDRRNGLWIDLAAVAWKVMQNHPERGRSVPITASKAQIRVPVERMQQLPIPEEFKPVFMRVARQVLTQPQEFDAAALRINDELNERMKPDVDGVSHPPAYWLTLMVPDAAREAPPAMTGAVYELWKNRLVLLATLASYPGDLSRFGLCGAIPWDHVTVMATFGKKGKQAPVPVPGRAWIMCELDGSLRDDMEDKAGEHTEHRYGELVDGKRQDVTKRTPWSRRGVLGLLVDRLKPILAEETIPSAAVPTFPNILRICEDVIGHYAALRPELFRQLISLKNQPGGPWRIEYSRDDEKGDPSLPPKVIHHTATFSELGGKPCTGITSYQEAETYADFDNFALFDPKGNGPVAGSEVQNIELRLAFLLRQLLDTMKVLAGGLPRIQREAKERGLSIDTVALARLQLALPVFPYWPNPAGTTHSDFDRIIRDEGQLLGEARLTLHQLALQIDTTRQVASLPAQWARFEGTKPGPAEGAQGLADPPKVLVGKEGRRKHVQERYQQLAQEQDSSGNAAYPSQEKILAKLADELNVSPRTLKDDIKWLRAQKRMPPLLNRKPREITNRMQHINPTRSTDR